LLAIGLAELDAGDFGDGVPLVGGFEWASEEILFFERLRRELRIDAGGAEELELGYAVTIGGIDDIILDVEVIFNKISRIGGIGEDAANFGSG
jgi:hypothetical protein